MRKMLLAVVCVGSGAFMMLLFGAVVLYQTLPPYLEPVVSKGTNFPLTVPDTPLAVLQVTQYTGPFLEKAGSQETVTAAALLVENVGGLYVAQGAVILELSGRQLVFELRDLPPGGKALILEKDAQPYIRETVWSCYGWAREEYPECFDWVTFEHLPQGLAVTNVTEATLPLLQLTYKRRTGQSNTFSGGISFQTTLQDLKPGETRLLKLPHYTQNGVAVVRTMVIVD